MLFSSFLYNSLFEIISHVLSARIKFTHPSLLYYWCYAIYIHYCIPYLIHGNLKVIDRDRIYRWVDKNIGSDWWPSGKQEERIKKECTGIKYQEWKGMVIPYQIWQGIILFFNSLQKREWKGMRRNYYSLWMVIFFRNVRECIIPRRSLVTIHTHRRHKFGRNVLKWKYWCYKQIGGLKKCHEFLKICIFPFWLCM